MLKTAKRKVDLELWYCAELPSSPQPHTHTHWMLTEENTGMFQIRQFPPCCNVYFLRATPLPTLKIKLSQWIDFVFNWNLCPLDGADKKMAWIFYRQIVWLSFSTVWVFHVTYLNKWNKHTFSQFSWEVEERGIKKNNKPTWKYSRISFKADIWHLSSCVGLYNFFFS